MSAVTPASPTAPGLTELQGLAAVMSALARVSDIDALLSTRPSEPRSTRLHVGYDEAAERLNIPEKWLRERISKLPHRKFGKFVQFAEEDLRAISDMHFVNPGVANDKEHESAVMPLQPSKHARKRF
ncbi:helix-turn-helix domain-containing protein [Streptomyces sp. SID10853]|uniref:helix-turn-helix domain-containing protein n=1 Tax=Streptomyces sp. SID10853 TaxID=2706028 RepID=UPI0013C08083|nr:helix-turn-helix domain-containing protein [Streptomyces sp. SID10853]NDZ76963.1 helix-turn-helix domain-containing protein [Streptomyces sp. SID10853]